MPSKIPILPIRLQPAVRRELDRLQRTLSRERGHTVSRTEAVATAVIEAVERRKPSSVHDL